MDSNETIRRQEVTHTQGSADWHAWRRQGIGASDVGVIMGETKYKSLYELWEEKLGISEPFEGNVHTRRGNELEPVVRDRYNLEYMCSLKPATFEYKPWPVLRASLDGIDSIGRHILEIKCPLGADHETAIGGLIPLKYVYQVQTQLLVSGAITGDYVSYRNGDMVIVPFRENKEVQERILKAVKDFWHFVETKTPPEPAPIPTKDLSNHGELKLLLAKWDDLVTREKIIELEKDLVKNRINEISDGSNAVCGYFKISHSERKGSVDYSRALEQYIPLVDIESYRRPSTKVVTITKTNEGI